MNYYDGNIYQLLQQIHKSDSLTDRQKTKLKGVINDYPTTMPINRRIANISAEFNKLTNAKFEDNQLKGGNHHTRKRTHKPRNTKSNTRKGHIYRTNHRRTHGKSSAHGKKQTRRIANR